MLLQFYDSTDAAIEFRTEPAIWDSVALLWGFWGEVEVPDSLTRHPSMGSVGNRVFKIGAEDLALEICKFLLLSGVSLEGFSSQVI